MMRFWFAAVLTVCASGLAVVQGAGAQGVGAQGAGPKSTDIIAARQGGMALTGALSDLMKAGVASGAEVKPYADGAAAFVKWAGAYPTLFPDGTQTGGNTKAKPEIWSDRAGFDKAAAAFLEASGKLSDAAKAGDKVAFAAAFGDVGKTCGGCHRNYKAR